MEICKTCEFKNSNVSIDDKRTCTIFLNYDYYDQASEKCTNYKKKISVVYVYKKNFLSLVIDNLPYNINKAHKHFDTIIDKLKNKDYDNLLELISDEHSIKKKIEKEKVDLVIKAGSIFYNGQKLHSSLVNQIIETKNQGFEFANLMKFLENLLENTNQSIINELYDWIEESGTISITEDGAFLAYKKIKEDYTDIYTGKIDNSVGQKPKMNKEDVDPDRERPCSAGLHFCSYDYLNRYGSCENNRVVIVKVFPQDVIAIPTDYNYQKGRCWTYEVIAELKDSKTEHCLTKTVSDYSDSEDIVITIESLEKMMKDYSIADMCKMYNHFRSLRGEPLLVKFTSRAYALKRIEQVFKTNYAEAKMCFLDSRKK